MKHRIAELPGDAERFRPEAEADGSGVGINYAEACIKALKTTLDDGRKILCKRRGLKLTLMIGDRQGAGLLRRLEHGPDVRAILAAALTEAARDAGAELTIVDGSVFLDLE